MDAVDGDAEAMTSLFGNVRALTGIMGLAGKSALEFERDLALMEKAAGSTEEAFKKQMQSLDFWINTATNALNKMKIAFYEGMVDPIRDVINSQEELDEVFASLTNTAKLAGEAMGTIGKGLKLLQPILEIQLENMAAFDETIARFVQRASFGLIPAYDKMKQAQWEVAVTAARLADSEKKVGENMKGIWGVLVRGQQEWKRQLDFYINSGMAIDEYLPKLRALWKGTSQYQLELKGLAAIEALDLKTKSALRDELTILVKNIEAAAESNQAFDKSLEPLAKKALKLAKLRGMNLARPCGFWPEIISYWQKRLARWKVPS